MAHACCSTHTRLRGSCSRKACLQARVCATGVCALVHVLECFRNEVLLVTFVPAVVSQKKDTGKKVRDDITKHCALLRNPLYGMDVAADHLENWIEGRLIPEPLLDVTAWSGFQSTRFVWPTCE